MAARSQREQQEITLLQERSAGTFARVYLAEARGADGLKRIVAVKILKAQWSDEPDLLNRTRDEARLLARLHHRNILRVEGLAEHSGQPAIIMEFVDGVDLGQLIEQRRQPIPPRAALHIARDAANALEAAYFRTPYGSPNPLNVVHRDIKPSNIMVSVEGEVKVLDFGTAHYENEIRLAQTGAMRLGSLKYMSPERRSGERGDHTCDIYALGIVLLEMLLGELLPVVPLDSSQHDRFIAQHIARIRNLGMPNREWDDALREALSRMCAHQTNLRLDARQLLKLLRNFSDQATGDSLDTFAAGPVRELARGLYGDGTQGAHTGNRMMVVLTGSGSFESPSTPAAPRRLEPVHEPLAEVGHIPIDRPGLEPVARAGHADIASPGRADHGSPGSAHAGQPQVAHAAPPDKSEGGLPRWVLFAIGGIFLGGFFLALVLAGAIAAWLFIGSEDVPPYPDGPPPQPAEISAPAESGALLSVTAEAEDIQWIKVTDADGNRIMRADPTAAETVPPGDYEISAKQVGQPVAKTTLTVEDSISFSCTPQKAGKIRCEDATGSVELLLTP